MKKEIVTSEPTKVDSLKGKFCFSTRCHGVRPAKFLRSGLPFCSNACVRHSGLKNPKLDSASKELYTFTTMTQGSSYLVNRGKKINTNVPVSEDSAFNPVAPGIKNPVQHGLVCNTMQGFGRGRK